MPSSLTYLGLYALQHRGQESAGIAAAHNGAVKLSRAMGYVGDAFNDRMLAALPGPASIGHVRYSTFGDSRIVNAQPILIDCAHGQIALCHNGNIVNAGELRQRLVREGSIFQTNSDTEVVLHLYARSSAATPEDAIVESVSQVQRRLLARPADPGQPDRGAGPPRLPPARSRPSGRRLCRLLRDLRDGPDRRDATSATWSRARCW